MSYLGDYATSAVIYGKFTTYRPSTGAPFTLAGTPVLSVYKDNSTTQSTTGVTLTVDFDSVTGLHHFAIDTSADGTFYAAGSNFDVVITTGTVDSVSAVGSVVGSFSLAKVAALRPATAGRTLVVDASGLADANTVKVGPTGSGTAQTARDIGASVLLSSGTGTGQISLSSGLVTLAAVTHTGAVIPTVTTLTNVPANFTSLAITATGAVGLNWGNIENKSTVNNLSGTIIDQVSSLETMRDNYSSGIWVATIQGDLDGNVRGSTLGKVPPFINGAGEAISGSGAWSYNHAGAALATPTNITAATGIVLSGVTHTGAVIPTVSAVTGLTASNLDVASSTLATAANLATLAGYVDTEVAAIKAKTDQLTFTVANQVDANALTGGGGLDAAATRAALGMASANLDTQLSGIQSDTNDIQTRLPAALTGAGNIKADMIALNGSTSAAVNASNAWDGIITGTATAGGAQTITLAAGSVNTLNFYKDRAISITAGTGATLTGHIASSSTANPPVCTLTEPWNGDAPDNTSVYQILGRIDTAV